MAKVTTLPLILQPLMGKPSIELPYCAVCGRYEPLNQHHIVHRGAGIMFDGHGHELKKPTITLCGFGNNLNAPDGGEWCHGLAHANRLHFRWVDGNTDKLRPGYWDVIGSGHWEYLVTKKPVKYQKALELPGWAVLL